MGLSRLTKECQKCLFKDTCENKQMECLGFLPDPIMSDLSMPVTTELTQPILRETINTIIDGKSVKVYKDEIEKQLNESLYKQLLIGTTY